MSKIQTELLRRAAPHVLGDQYITARVCVRGLSDARAAKVVDAMVKNLNAFNVVGYKRHVWVDRNKYNGDGTKR